MTATVNQPLLPQAMSRSELQDHVDHLAARPELWQHLVTFDGSGQRHYVSLHRDDVVDVWLLCWNTVDDTGWHDHDISSGAVAVVQGAVRQSTLRLADGPVVEDFASGESFTFGPDHIHRMTGAVDGSVSIHAYSPPLTRMGQYSFDREGVLRRTSVGYEEELRSPEGAVD
ncbi:cysteine dioxygenase [Pseudonocardia sp. GCM10023141]|uniref:cysteine dioxygenase n=1 Tax=Pseudonocardia sp. GCM10023141 TaxID=3252653 RepID=UPI00361E7977